MWDSWIVGRRVDNLHVKGVKGEKKDIRRVFYQRLISGTALRAAANISPDYLVA